MFRTLTPQKPQRATVSTETKPVSLRKPDQSNPPEQRQYPAAALGLMLVTCLLYASEYFRRKWPARMEMSSGWSANDGALIVRQAADKLK